MPTRREPGDEAASCRARGAKDVRRPGFGKGVSGVVSLSAVELAERVRSATGLRLRNGTAAMFLGYWLEAGVVVELVPGRYELTAKGERLAAGLLAADPAERGA